MSRSSMPQPERAPAPGPRSHPDAYVAGVLAFFSVIYVVLNSQPLVATLVVGTLWGFGIALHSILSRGRWRVVLGYLMEWRRLLTGPEEAASERAQASAPAAEGVELSAREREEFAKLMGSAGFTSEHPKE